MNQGHQTYPYFAFISYKREDKKWAKWLQRNLQSYRLPTRICRQNRELPKRLSPVFLDVENLTSGRLGEPLRSETQASKFLIVICSRHAHDHSTYLDQEIRFFLETHQATHVIPFIVDDSPTPEKDWEAKLKPSSRE